MNANRKDRVRNDLRTPILGLRAMIALVSLALFCVATSHAIRTSTIDRTTQLLVLAHRGDLGGVNRLLREGIPVDATDEFGTTPLIDTSRAGQLAVCDRLLRCGANVNARAHCYGTPLMQAALQQHDDVVRLLLRYGADPNLHSDIDGSPLLMAVLGEDPQIVDSLLAGGARAEDVFADGRTALDVAIEMHQRLIVEKLRAATNAEWAKMGKGHVGEINFVMDDRQDKIH